MNKGPKNGVNKADVTFFSNEYSSSAKHSSATAWLGSVFKRSSQGY